MMTSKKISPVQIIGHPGSGKTTLMVELIEAFTKKGMTVASLKHSAHNHELDKPGKDSFLHRQAGANPAAMMTSAMSAIYIPRKKNQTPEDLIKQFLSNTDIILIEGWISGPYKKIEVFRENCGREPLYNTVNNVMAFVTEASNCLRKMNQAENKGLKIFDRSTTNKDLIKFIVSLAGNKNI